MSVFGGTVWVHFLSSLNNSWPFISESVDSDSESSTCSFYNTVKGLRWISCSLKTKY